MKRVLIALLILAMTLSSSAEEMILGGWQTNAQEFLPEDAVQALESATANMVGCRYEPVACLATQIVAGRNYCLLCRLTPVVPDAISEFALVYVYAALDGEAEILDIRPLSISLACDPAEDGQNPVMNIVGPYFGKTSQRAHMTIECEGTNTAVVTIEWANSAFENVVWRLSGEYDWENAVIAYTDCVKTIETYADDGTCSVATVYENGTGTITLTENREILWQDEVENAGEGCVFEFCG